MLGHATLDGARPKRPLSRSDDQTATFVTRGPEQVTTAYPILQRYQAVDVVRLRTADEERRSSPGQHGRRRGGSAGSDEVGVTTMGASLAHPSRALLIATRDLRVPVRLDPLPPPKRRVRSKLKPSPARGSKVRL